jgi:hypothetical protein
MYPLVKDTQGATTLQFHVHMLQLRGINTANQTFDCTLMIHVRWYETTDDCEWAPALSFTNAVEDLRVHHNEVRRAHMGPALVHACMTLLASGTFAECFELTQFPLDCQRLHVHVSILNCPMWRFRSRNRPDVEEERPSIATAMFGQRFRLILGDVRMDDDGFMEGSAWEMLDRMRVSRCRTRTSDHPEGLSFCKITVYATVHRLPIYHFWNAVFPVSIQVLLAFVTCYVSLDDMGTKAQITLTIILTIFAIRFSLAQTLPAVSCLTWLDMYFVLATFWACAVVVQNLIMFYEERDRKDEHDVHFINLLSGGGLCATWVLFNTLVYLIMLNKPARRAFVRRHIEDVLDEEIDDRATTYTSAASSMGSPINNALFWPRHSIETPMVTFESLANIAATMHAPPAPPPLQPLTDDDGSSPEQHRRPRVTARRIQFDCPF